MISFIKKIKRSSTLNFQALSQKIFAVIEKNHIKDLQSLKNFLKIPSISTDPQYKYAIDEAAYFLKEYFEELGFDAEILVTKGHPVVYARLGQDPNKPTVLCYGHYDVQPADPLSLWISDPFDPQIRDGYLYARGASDDKGQIFCHLHAVKTLLTISKELPVNLIFLIEGEEEIGSPHLKEFLKEHQEKLSAQYLLVSDTPMYAPKMPSLCYGLRGLLYVELQVRSTAIDLHSGQQGGIVQNPILGLAYILSQLKNKDHEIQIPGFYRDVRPLSSEEKRMIDGIPFDDQEYSRLLGAKKLVGEKQYSANMRRWFRPTLDCNGIISGYTGPGSKTIIPAMATAKLSMRLIPYQDPMVIFNALQDYLFKICPEGLDISLSLHTASKPLLISRDSKGIKAAEKALKMVFGINPILQGEGGSIPILNAFKSILGLDPILMGFNLPDDAIHAPNERFGIQQYRDGIHSTALFFHYIGLDL